MSSASGDLNIDKTYSSLRLIGGDDCVPRKGRYPDLYIAGGAKIRKKLCAQNVDVTDEMTVKDITVTEELNAATANIGDLTVRNTLTVCGTIQGKTKLNVQGDMLVNGTIFSSEDEFTQLITFQGNGNVIVEPIADPGLMFMNNTLKIVNPPCSGNILSVNPFSGDVLYCPQSEPSKTDIYQYCIEDVCGIPHIVTQFICQQSIGSNTAPFFNNDCVEYLNDGTPSAFPVNVDVTDLVVPGTNPVDFASVVVKDFTLYISEFGANEFVCGNVANAIWGTFAGGVPLATLTETTPQVEWTGTGSGLFAGTTLTYTLSYNGTDTLTLNYVDSSGSSFEPTDIYARATVQIADTFGSLSNCGTIFFVADSDLGPLTS